MEAEGGASSHEEDDEECNVQPDDSFEETAAAKKMKEEKWIQTQMSQTQSLSSSIQHAIHFNSSRVQQESQLFDELAELYKVV